MIMGPTVPAPIGFGSSAKVRFFDPVAGSNPLPRIVFTGFGELPEIYW